MGALSITGIKPGSTNLELTAGKITKTVPITVLSRNLLSYGPAEGNGLTATVNTDGSLHVTGTVTSRHKGLAWRCPTPSDALGKTVTYKAKSPSDTYSYVAFFNKAGNQVGDIALNKSVTVPADAASCELRLLAGDTYTVGTRIDDTFKPMLNLGDRALDWMKPDNTSLRGGSELANLFPRVTGLPKTLGAAPGITVTEPSPGTYRFKGSTTTGAGSWSDLQCTVHVEAGTYTLDAIDWPLGSKSWLMGMQAHLTPDDGSERTDVFGPNDYGPKTLKTGTLQCNIFVNTTGEVDKTFTPRLYKID